MNRSQRRLKRRIDREAEKKLAKSLARDATDSTAPSQLRPVLFQQQSVSTSFTGPLPPPSILAGYGAIQPDLVDRVVGLTERQSAHRQTVQMIDLRARIRLSTMGSVFGFVIALVGLGAATGLVLSGHPWPGTIIGTVDLVALVSVFVIGKRRETPASTTEITK